MKKRFVEDAEPYKLCRVYTDIHNLNVGDGLPDVPKIIFLQPFRHYKNNPVPILTHLYRYIPGFSDSHFHRG